MGILQSGGTSRTARLSLVAASGEGVRMLQYLPEKVYSAPSLTETSTQESELPRANVLPSSKPSTILPLASNTRKKL
jgi:hypothetical protein